jgi:hypothetical protein
MPKAKKGAPVEVNSLVLDIDGVKAGNALGTHSRFPHALRCGCLHSALSDQSIFHRSSQRSRPGMIPILAQYCPSSLRQRNYKEFFFTLQTKTSVCPPPCLPGQSKPETLNLIESEGQYCGSSG